MNRIDADFSNTEEISSTLEIGHVQDENIH